MYFTRSSSTSPFVSLTLGQMDRKTEKKTILAAQKGDAEAFEKLYNAFKLELYRSALLIMKHPADAEDAVAETFIKTFRAIDRFDTKYPMRPWLHRILRNECNNIFKKKRTKTVLYDDFGTDWKESVADRDSKCTSTLIIEDEEDSRLMELIDSMNDSHREVLILHYYDGLDLIKIAEIIGVPIGTVKSRLFHARKQLLKSIEENEVILDRD